MTNWIEKYQKRILKFQKGSYIKSYDNSLKANVNRIQGKVRSKVPENFWFLPGLSDAEDAMQVKDAFSGGSNLDKGIAVAGIALPFVSTKAIKGLKNAFKYSKFGQFINDIPRSFTEVQEVKKIKKRIDTTSYGDVQEWKKSRMLKGTVPNYNQSDRILGRWVRMQYTTPPSNDDLETFLRKSSRAYESTFPTKRTYIERIKYPKVRLVNDIVSSNVTSTTEPNFIEIGENFINSYPKIEPMPGPAKPFVVGTVFNHELDHYIGHPTVSDKHNFKKFLDYKNLDNYYTGVNHGYKIMPNFGTEIKARLGQVKDLLGVKGTEQITKPQLRAALKVMNSSKKYGLIENNLTFYPIKQTNFEVPLFRRVTDINKMLDYMNKAPLDPYLTAHKKGGWLVKINKEKNEI